MTRILYAFDMKKKIKHSRRSRTGQVAGDYDGEINNKNLPHGKGKCIFEDGLVYNGSWVNGKREGARKMTFPNKDYYEGEWKNDAPNGKGEHFIGGEYYEGDFVEGNRHGKGKYIWIKENTKYVGEFVDNLKHGLGIFYDENDSVYEGNWSEDKRYGTGKITLKDGSSMSGFFNDTEIEGEATVKLSGGENFKGKYKDLLSINELPQKIKEQLIKNWKKK